MLSRPVIRLFLLRHAKLTGLVAVATGVLCFFLMKLFPAMRPDDAAAISASWPPLMRDLFGDPLLGFSDAYAWMYLQVFHIMFWVIYGVLASILAAGIVAKEIEDKTMDILLSYPVTRSSLVASQLVAVFMLLLLAVAPATAGRCLGLVALGIPVRWASLVLVSLEGTLLSFACGTLTLLISVILPSQILSVSLALAAFGFMFFFDTLLVKLMPVLEHVAFLNPFHFYAADAILLHDSPSVGNLLALLMVSLALAAVSLAGFSRKDIAC